MNWINLLSGKPLSAFAPDEFKTYVRGLYFKKAKKEPVFKIKKVKAQLEYKKTAKGNLSITIRREPKTITRAELSMIIDALAFDFTEEQIMKKLKKITITE